MHTEDWKAVFTTYDALELGAALGILEGHGIDTLVRDLSVSPYPVTVGPMAEKHILVPAESADRARQLIEEAVADGFLSTGKTQDQDTNTR